VTGSGVQVTVGHREISADVGTNPVSDVLLVHGVLVGLVFAGAGAVQVARLGVRLHAEGKLGKLSGALLGLGRIAEVKVAGDVVDIGAGSWVFGVLFLFGAARAV
jgi:hypothetical protein